MRAPNRYRVTFWYGSRRDAVTYTSNERRGSLENRKAAFWAIAFQRGDHVAYHADIERIERVM